MAKKKVSRKKLLKEPDEFMTLTGNLIQFATTHKRQLGYLLAALIAVALIVTGYRYMDQKAEANAAISLKNARTKYENELKEKGPGQAYEAATAEFKQILDKYPNTEAGRLARVDYANICYRAGDYEKAIGLYEQALRDFAGSETILDLIRSDLGYAYEGKKDPQKAISYFEMIASNPGAVARDEALFNLGRLYEELGEKEKSQQAYKKLVDEYSDSIYLELAKEKIVG